MAGGGCPEVRLQDSAAWGVAPAGDREERMHAAIGCAVRLDPKARFPDRSILRDEERDLVARALFIGHLHLWVHSRTGPAYIRLYVTAGAPVQVEAWAEARFRVGDCALDRLNFLEVLTTHTEHLLFECGQSGERAAGARRAWADPRVARYKHIRADTTREHSGHEHHRTAREHDHPKSTPYDADSETHGDLLMVRMTCLPVRTSVKPCWRRFVRGS